MIRILHVLHSMNRGGAEAMLMNYYRNIDRTQVQFDFLLTEQNHCQYEDEIVSMGGKVFRVPLLSIRNPFPYINGVRSFLTSHPEYQIVHSHTSSKSAVPLWVAKCCGVPVRICHSHNNRSETGIFGLVRDILKCPLRFVSTDFFSCGYDASVWLYGKKIADSGEVKILFNAIDVPLYEYKEQARLSIRNNYSLSNSTLVLGMVSRFSHQKNHAFALDVLKALKDYGANVQLMLVGDGELHEEIVGKIRALNLEKETILVGIVGDVQNYLQSMDVVLMPSFNEGLPVSMIEAQASGVRCIVSTGVPKEVDVTGNVDFLPLDETQWTKHITNLPMGWRDLNATEKVRAAGYDIVAAAETLQNWYVQKWNSLK